MILVSNFPSPSVSMMLNSNGGLPSVSICTPNTRPSISKVMKCVPSILRYPFRSVSLPGISGVRSDTRMISLAEVMMFGNLHPCGLIWISA